MEYVRRKRIIAAAEDLTRPDSNITNVAFKYQFNSNDVFARAFKRLYGVTPSQYKKINASALSNDFYITEEDDFMISLNAGQKLLCSNIEKRECLELLDKIMRFSEIARSRGLLALEPEIDKFDSLFIRKALRFIVQGMEPGYIRAILQNYITVGDYKGKALLERILAMEGVLSIQAGENPLLIREKLASFFGEDYIPVINDYFKLNEDPSIDAIKDFINQVKDVQPASPETLLLEEPLAELSPRSLQRLLRDIELTDLVNALKGSGGNIQISIINNLSRKLALIIIEELKSPKQLTIQHIAHYQGRILETLRKLRADGEII